MKREGWLFAGMALFFGVTGLIYWIFSQEPAGTTVLAIAFLMSSLVAFFFQVQYRKGGLRPQDRGEGRSSTPPDRSASSRPAATGRPPPRSA